MFAGADPSQPEMMMPCRPAASAQINSYWQQTLVGVIIIAAVLVDRLRSRVA